VKLVFSLQIFEKYSNIKFHENLSRGSRVVPCGKIDGRTDLSKQLVAFQNFANALKNNFLHLSLNDWAIEKIRWI